MNFSPLFFCFKKKQKIILKQEKKFITQYYPAFHIAFDVFFYSFFFQKRGKYESAVLKPSKQAGRQHKKGKYKVEEKNIGALTFLIKHYIYNP